MEDVEIVAICDLNVERLRMTADKYGVKRRYTDYRRMLKEVRMDAIYIITPPHQLFDLVMDCLEAQLDVFIEKPPGVTAEQTRNMARLARKNGCITMVGFNRRFIPLMRKVKEMVEKRGPIVQCVATFYKYESLRHVVVPPYYRGAVDILTCDAIHCVDTLRWMCGEAREVVSMISKFYVDYENSFNALIRFESGAVGILMTNWAAGHRIHTFEMHARGISAFVNPDDKAVIYMDDRDQPVIIGTQEAAGSNDRVVYYGFYAENRHFIDCVKEGKQPETNFEDAAKTMELVERIYRAAVA